MAACLIKVIEKFKKNIKPAVLLENIHSSLSSY